MNEEEIVKIYKALSVKSRLQILKLIKDKELCVNAITGKLDISQPAVSQHLSVLKKVALKPPSIPLERANDQKRIRTHSAIIGTLIFPYPMTINQFEAERL